MPDWYLVDDWAALGTLNETAVRGSREVPHGRAAAAAADGIAGVYALRLGVPAKPGWAGWLHKPRELGYQRFESELRAAAEGETASLWRRQMTLGPTPLRGAGVGGGRAALAGGGDASDLTSDTIGIRIPAVCDWKP